MKTPKTKPRLSVYFLSLWLLPLVLFFFFSPTPLFQIAFFALILFSLFLTFLFIFRRFPLSLLLSFYFFSFLMLARFNQLSLLNIALLSALFFSISFLI